MTAARNGALHQAKLLQGELLRLVERRDRQVARAQGAFQLDLLATIEGKPAWLLNSVHRALLSDRESIAAQTLLDAMVACGKASPPSSLLPGDRTFLGDLAQAAGIEPEPATLSEDALTRERLINQAKAAEQGGFPKLADALRETAGGVVIAREVD